MDNKMYNYQVFPREYFSGVDCYISFNDIPIDQIVSLQFSVMEPIIPIHGYASYTYDAVAHGARMVSGTFTIAFKESFYIRSVLDKLEATSKEAINESMPVVGPHMTPDELLLWMQGNHKENKIWAVAEEYANKLWAKSEEEIVNKQHQPFFTKVGSNMAEKGFDIILSYGRELIELGKAQKEKFGSVKYINGVHISGVTQRVAPSGEPLYEEYSFIAKDIDNTI